jgi:hypothetical protein
VKPRRCKAKNLAGKPCGVTSHMVGESGYCFRHDPDKAEERARQSRRGGETTRRRHMKAGLKAADLGPLVNAADAQRWLERIAGAVGARELTHSEGQAMTRAVAEWIRARDLHVREVKLAELQRQLKELQEHQRQPPRRMQVVE